MNKLILGNSLEELKGLKDNSIDSIVTDPPYELGFMGKSWDNTGIANNTDLWRECFRVLKPGGHLLAFSGTRTYHRMAVAIEDAGFEVRDMIEWVYGSGFPKSLNIGKAVDKLQGNERAVIGQSRNGANSLMGGLSGTETTTIQDVTKGTSEWEGWGTALKPAHETIAVAQKPLTAVPFYGNIEEEIKSILCQLLLSVKTANKNLVLNHHGLSEELDIAQWIVKDSTNTQVALSVVMDMLQLELKTNTNWSIELLCLSFLKEIWKHTNIFTTEMKTSLIIELRTLNLLVSESILANITQSKKIKQNGENANVYFVENYLNAVLLKWNATLTHFAQENVMSKENKLTFAPNHEPICMARKPLAEKTVAENVLKYGTGGINIDESRVEANKDDKFGGGGLNSPKNGFMGNTENTYKKGTGFRDDTLQGRFPANLLHDNSDEVRECFPETKSGGDPNRFAKTDGGWAVSKFDKAPVCNLPADSGSASRFFKSIIYQAKASKAERNKGCEGLKERDKKEEWGDKFGAVDRRLETKNQSTGTFKNHHPTVKPIQLMEYLIKMVTPKGGTVLDPFMGSGSTGVAAKKNGYDFIGIDMTPEYIEIAKARINYYEDPSD